MLGDGQVQKSFFPRIIKAIKAQTAAMTNTAITIQNITSSGLIDRYSSSSDFWIRVSDICAAFVVIGILAEILELTPKLLKAALKLKWRIVAKREAKITLVLARFKKYEHWIEVLAFGFWMVIVVALAGELLGAMIARHFDSLTIRSLSQQATAANLESSEAVKQAGEANERASIFDLERAKIDKEAEELRSNNLALQLKMQPRIINETNVQNFMLLTHGFPKFPIRLVISAPGEEANFGVQLRMMLNAAGYGIPDGDTNEALGIHYQPMAVRNTIIFGDTNAWPDVAFMFDHEINLGRFDFVSVTETNGLYIFTLPAGDTNAVYGALMNAFSQIGVKVEGYNNKPDWLATNHCGIFVIERPF
jgi:hypothetical protein